VATHDILIVGGGPAGCAAAIHAANLRPDLTDRILLLDKAQFPRVKICGGGVVRRADHLLQRMGIALDVDASSIHAARFVFPARAITIKRANMFRIVRRAEFDHALLQFAQSKGIHIRQEAPVLELQRSRDAILVHTPRETYRASVVIGADGANGITRRAVAAGRPRLSMVGLETFTDPVHSELGHRARHMAVFDFTCTMVGVQGYSWDFPAGADAMPLVNRGVFHSHISGRDSRLNLKSYLADSLRQRGIATDPGEIKGHPAHMYDPSVPCSAPRIVLAGDAIGVEPLLGEGISSALETGMMAAEAACRALATGDHSFRTYGAEIRASHRARSMLLKRRAAERFYVGQATWWVLLAAVGLGAAYNVTSQMWEGLAGKWGGAAPNAVSVSDEGG
jgi:menaquinone-9 beta-reductase